MPNSSVIHFFNINTKFIKYDAMPLVIAPYAGRAHR